MNQPSFFVDSMLGTIAKKLRMFGFDCKYDSAIDDEDLILIAEKERRVIITRDARLATNSMQHDIATIKIQKHIEKEQLIEIACKIGWKRFELAYSRCSLCNGILKIVSKDQIMQKTPPRIAESTEKFWQCKECNHIYWVGTHIRNMEKLIAEINARL